MTASALRYPLTPAARRELAARQRRESRVTVRWTVTDAGLARLAEMEARHAIRFETPAKVA